MSFLFDNLGIHLSFLQMQDIERHKCTFYEKLDHLPQKPFTIRETRRSYISSDILFVSRNLNVNYLNNVNFQFSSSTI